jgi:hypothetical protein
MSEKLLICNSFSFNKLFSFAKLTIVSLDVVLCQKKVEQKLINSRIKVDEHSRTKVKLKSDKVRTKFEQKSNKSRTKAKQKSNKV